MAREDKVLVTQQLIEDVLTLVTEGQLLRQAAEVCGMPLSTLYRRFKSDPATWELYRRARELGANAIAEYAVDIADNDPDSKRARNRIMVRQWLASKLDPKTYGDKLDLTITETVDMRSSIDRGRARAVPLRPVRDQRDGSITYVPDESTAYEPEPADTDSVAGVPDLDIFR